MTEFLPRSAWTSDPKPPGATLLVAGQVEGFAVHWPGDPGSISADRASVVRRLQGELKYHTDPAPAGRGWSDIAYQVAIDQAGRVWELRGVDRRSAANGDTEVNQRFGAATCLVGADDVPTPALLQAVRDFRTKVWLPKFPHATKVVCHSDIRPGGTAAQPSTDCPGGRLRAQVRAGTFTSTGDIDMAITDAELDKIEDRLWHALTQRQFTSSDEVDPDLRGRGLASLLLVDARSVEAIRDAIGLISNRTSQAGAQLASLADALAQLATVTAAGGVDVDQLADAIASRIPDDVAGAVADKLSQRLAQ